MVGRSLEAAEILADQGVDVSVLDPRTLSPLDDAPILEDVARTGRALLVQEAPGHVGYTAEIAARITESPTLYRLLAPIRRLSGLNAPIPYAPQLESASVPQVPDIVEPPSPRGVRNTPPIPRWPRCARAWAQSIGSLTRPVAIRMPKMSMTMTEGEVSSWSVKVGDEITDGDTLRGDDRQGRHGRRVRGRGQGHPPERHGGATPSRSAASSVTWRVPRKRVSATSAIYWADRRVLDDRGSAPMPGHRPSGRVLPADVLVHPDQRLPLREDLSRLAHQPARQVVEHERQGMVPGLVEHAAGLAREPVLEVADVVRHQHVRPRPERLAAYRAGGRREDVAEVRDVVQPFRLARQALEGDLVTLHKTERSRPEPRELRLSCLVTGPNDPEIRADQVLLCTTLERGTRSRSRRA